MMSIRFVNRRGISLVELQVSLAIAFVTLLAAVALYIFYWRTFVIGNNMLDVYSNSRVAVELIARDTRWAKQVVSQYPETGSPVYTTTDSVIVLKIPSVGASNSIIESQYDYIIYRLQGNDLYRIVVPFSTGLTPSVRKAENRIVAHYCSSLTFSSGDVTLSHISNLSTVNTIGVYLPLNKSTISLSGTGTGTATIVPTTIIRLRNK